MNVNPNKFDTRVVRKFKTQLGLTDKEIESELKHLPQESEDNYSTVTGVTLEEVESRNNKSKN